MASELQNAQEQFRRLNKIGIALSSERNLEILLTLILEEARHFTHADGGSLYIREGDSLLFKITQNNTLAGQYKKSPHQKDYAYSNLPVSRESIAGYVASTGKIVNISDAYEISPDQEYRFDAKFDKERLYRTKSILAFPLKDPEGEIMGVLQLINALDENKKVIPFSKTSEELIQSLASQAAVSIKNAKLMEELKKAHLDTIFRLSTAAEYKDEDTAHHLQRISTFSVILAQQMNLSKEEVDLLKYASPMHDIGKLGIPDAILLKPGKLTPEEYEEMKKHTIYGAKILEGSDLKLFSTAKEIALTHHEKFNGTGYPRGLKKGEIPLFGRIVAVADVFDAVTAKRVYREPLPLEKALEIIQEESGKHFDPDVVRAFFDSLDQILESAKKNGLIVTVASQAVRKV